jgi:hypothetical protein
MVAVSAPTRPVPVNMRAVELAAEATASCHGEDQSGSLNGSPLGAM